jgi:YhcH/YjgK/YiaL family protein
MIFGNLNYIGAYALYPEPIVRALKYLLKVDLELHSPGEYEIEGRAMYVKIRDKLTQTSDHVYPEVHKQYVDLQYTPFGNEQIGYTYDNGCYEVLEDRLNESDTLIYRDVNNETWLQMQPGSFAVFFPWDIHRPGCAVDQPIDTRKIVIKISLSLFSPMDDHLTTEDDTMNGILNESRGELIWK